MKKDERKKRERERFFSFSCFCFFLVTLLRAAGRATSSHFFFFRRRKSKKFKPFFSRTRRADRLGALFPSVLRAAPFNGRGVLSAGADSGHRYGSTPQREERAREGFERNHFC